MGKKTRVWRETLYNYEFYGKRTNDVVVCPRCGRIGYLIFYGERDNEAKIHRIYAYVYHPDTREKHYVGSPQYKYVYDFNKGLPYSVYLNPEGLVKWAEEYVGYLFQKARKSKQKSVIKDYMKSIVVREVMDELPRDLSDMIKSELSKYGVKLEEPHLEAISENIANALKQRIINATERGMNKALRRLYERLGREILKKALPSYSEMMVDFSEMYRKKLIREVYPIIKKRYRKILEEIGVKKETPREFPEKIPFAKYCGVVANPPSTISDKVREEILKKASELARKREQYALKLWSNIYEEGKNIMQVDEKEKEELLETIAKALSKITNQELSKENIKKKKESWI